MARSGGSVQARFDFSASGSRAFARPHPGTENIKSGLNGVAMPSFGLIVSGSTATASGMPLGALGAPKRPQILQKQRFSCFSGPWGGPPSLLGMPGVPLRDAHCIPLRCDPNSSPVAGSACCVSDGRAPAAQVQLAMQLHLQSGTAALVRAQRHAAKGQ